MRRQVQGGCSAPFHVGAGSPSNTMWPGPRPISVPSCILIYPTVWRAPTLQTADRQTSRTDRTTVRYHRVNHFTNCRPKTAHDDGRAADSQSVTYTFSDCFFCELCKETAELIDMPFGTRVGTRNHVLDRGPDYHKERGNFDECLAH